MQKLINIFVIVFILIGMVFFGAKAMSSDYHAPKEEQSSQVKPKEAKKDKDKKEKTKPKKAKEAETETEETPVYDPNVSQEAQVPVEQTEVPESTETVEDVQQPDTSYTPPVQQAPAYTNPQTYVPQQAPSQAEQSYNTVDNQNGQQTDALNNDQIYNAN
ncbi:hypothetical protein CD122_00560 [Staphylococcus rostri]|uniref:DUF4887 domain-containing protein n=1 Tax=Staphylococcus rostri TaxID=522262 RepID=A0A2K3YXJ2_9STAP|nr:hypothetical protein [Staphylococcus rostri]PNZ30326.1 hypothetical protein CD122_00560 [Staphylococcus rostri]